MSRNWEASFTSWSNGPTKTEEERIQNVIRQVRKAIDASEKLKDRNIKVFVHGSYRNRVNIKQDSDIDMGVVCFDVFFPEYNDDNIKSVVSKSFSDSSYEYKTFKLELFEALVGRFGSTSVKLGDKAIDIKENTYRVDADVSAFFEHRRYTGVDSYLSGVEMIPDSNVPSKIKNWPEQHYENGVYKNDSTNRRYKKMVRILKKLASEMRDNGYESAKAIPSFLIECLVWNVPNGSFGKSTYKDELRSCLVHLFNNTLNADKCSDWGEVSELKYIFKGTQPWTIQSAHKFISDAWDYVGYE